uniref:MHC class I-like antigen recognition-like domain-containing protein n=1 Tax=Terrapene triunguis TaxID=2587831 RepID=A0A674JZN0_9SAUR
MNLSPHLLYPPLVSSPLPTASPPVPPESLTLRLLQTIIFHNASSTDMELTALLGDLETHSLDCSTCEIRFLQPWPVRPRGERPHVPAPDPSDLQTVCPHPPALPLPDPFVTQVSTGCELLPNGTSRGFYDGGMNGEDFVSFDADAGKWVARRGDKLALHIQDILNYNWPAANKLQFLLKTTCVNKTKSFVHYGKESLARQGEAGHNSLLIEMQPPLGWGRGSL